MGKCSSSKYESEEQAGGLYIANRALA